MTHLTDVTGSYIKDFVFRTVTLNNRLFAQLRGVVWATPWQESYLGWESGRVVAQTATGLQVSHVSITGQSLLLTRQRHTHTYTQSHSKFPNLLCLNTWCQEFENKETDTTVSPNNCLRANYCLDWLQLANPPIDVEFSKVVGYRNSFSHVSG